MRAVLGIDAAWTAHNPSGVALAVEVAGGWRLIAAEPSYEHFLARANGKSLAGYRPVGSMPDAAALLSASKILCGCNVALVAVDMPLSLQPITRSRLSDRDLTRAYAARWCSTHQPTVERPGKISDALRTDFQQFGYELATCNIPQPCLAEVYPHPALVELTGDEKRLPYKLSRAGKYWKELKLTPLERRRRVIDVWQRIVTLLEGQISNVDTLLGEAEPDMPLADLKAHEDTLDAIICAWVGTCILEGHATAYGDDVSAIWVPRGDAIRWTGGASL